MCRQPFGLIPGLLSCGLDAIVCMLARLLTRTILKKSSSARVSHRGYVQESLHKVG
jgi:hypothetical protein